jgi:hypothetical protein
MSAVGALRPSATSPYAVPLEGLRDLDAREVLVPRDDAAFSLDESDLATQLLERLRHLHADRPGADDDESARYLRGGRRFAVGPDALEPVEPFDRGKERLRATGQDHRLARFELLAGDGDATLPREPAATAHEGDPVALDPRHQHAVAGLAGSRVDADHLVAAAKHGSHVGAAVEALPHAGDPARFGEHLGWPQERLRRDARPVRALTADQPVLDERHLQAAIGEPRGRLFAGRSATDHDDVKNSHVVHLFLRRGRMASAVLLARDSGRTRSASYRRASPIGSALLFGLYA